MKTNHSKISREFCERNILFFFPANEAESVLIQRRLFKLGYSWGRTQIQQVAFSAETLQQGILVLGVADGTNKAGIYTAGNSDSYKARGLLCTASQFETGDGPEIKADDEATLREEFNRMASQLKKMTTQMAEMAAQIEEMHDQIMPKSLDKEIAKSPTLK